MPVHEQPVKFLWSCSFCENKVEHIHDMTPPKGWLRIYSVYKDVDDGDGFLSNGEESFHLCNIHATKYKVFIDILEGEKNGTTA